MSEGDTVRVLDMRGDWCRVKPFVAADQTDSCFWMRMRSVAHPGGVFLEPFGAVKGLAALHGLDMNRLLLDGGT